MNVKSDAKCFPRSTKAAAALLAFVVAAAPAVFARDRSTKPNVESVTTLSHVQFSGAGATHMRLVKDGKSRLLYIGLDSSREIQVVDITNPEQPRIIERPSR